MRSTPEVFAAALAVLERAAQHRSPVTYQALSEEVDGLTARGRAMNDLLLDVDDWSWERHGVLLAVLVTNASGARLPGPAFSTSLAEHRPDDARTDPATAARRERERVYRAYP